MADAITSYLNKRASIEGRPLLGAAPGDDVFCVVVIPALAESAHLFETLRALSACRDACARRTLALCVVNNRPAPHASEGEIADNVDTLDTLEAWARTERLAPMTLAWVDASTPGNELPAHEGVGLARKIGADHGLALFALRQRPDAPIVHLDADSPPAPGYLDAVHGFYMASPRWAGYADYRHPLAAGDTPETRAMLAYEIYMRYHELGMRWAGSPYAWPALGSIMSSTAAAYAASGGMNRRRAGEDFYFMQQLTKTGVMEHIRGACVYPSARVSYRTPFGTGRSVALHATNHRTDPMLYHPECYTVLRRWLRLAAREHAAGSTTLIAHARAESPELGGFLERYGFVDAWDKIRQENRNSDRRLRQFHVWFDGLRTIQLIHHLRDTAWCDIPMREAVVELLRRYAVPAPGDASLRQLLEILRRLCAASVLDTYTDDKG